MLAELDTPTTSEDVFLFPATAAQRRFWTLESMFPGGNPALNMPLAVRLNGSLDRPTLERALQEVVARHEALRTTFHFENGRLSQLIAPEIEITIAQVSADDFPEDEQARVPEHLMREEAQRSFDLERGPLIRARLVRITEFEHLLLITMHHAICDGWSNGLILKELAALYGAFAHGDASPLPEPSLQFADFADWQAESLSSGALEPHFAYWRKQLAGDWPMLDLPIDHERRAGHKPTAEIRWRALPAELARELKAMATRSGASPFMVYLAGCNALLNRLCANRPEDIVVSTPSANRTRAEVESVVGLFVNPLLLRTNLAGDPTFTDLLARVRTTALGAFEHADAPFEWVIDELGPRRLQVSFLHQQAFMRPAKADDLAFAPMRTGTGSAVFEWTIGAIEDGAGMRLFLDYNADLFDDATAERVLAQYQSLLEQAAAAPETRLSAFAIEAPARANVAGASAKTGQGTPYLTMHYQMIEIWQELLKVSPIGIQDNFFDLGGNSLLALRMLTKVEAVCGRALLPAALFKNATIEHLAKELLTKPDEKSSAILKVNEAGSKTPLFYLHGDMTGGGYYTMKLSRALGADQPFYTLPPERVNANDGLPSIQAMAARHIEAIRTVQPRGPYAIGGFCIGGLIAYEVAQQLHAAGETVKNLIIIDASVVEKGLARIRRYAEGLGRRRNLDAVAQLERFCRWFFLLARFERWRGLGIGEQLAIFWKRLSIQFNRAVGKRLPSIVHQDGTRPPSEEDEDPNAWYDPQWDLPLVFLWASGGYRAKPYPENLTLLLSSDIAGDARRDPAIDWKKFAPKMIARNLPGSHLACITDHVDALAAAMREILK